MTLETLPRSHTSRTETTARPNHDPTTDSVSRSPTGRRAAYAACAWAVVFGAISFYWAAGGRVGADTISAEVTRLPGIVLVLWIVGFAKVVAALLALALVRDWGRAIPRRLLLISAWATGAGLILYGAVPIAVRGLMAIGVIDTPASMHGTLARWHLLLWDPWWLLGGLLFATAAWHYGRARNPRSYSAPSRASVDAAQCVVTGARPPDRRRRGGRARTARRIG